MFVVVVMDWRFKDRLYFVNKGLSDVCVEYSAAAKFKTRPEAQGAGLLLAARRPNFIGRINVIRYESSIRVGGP